MIPPSRPVPTTGTTVLRSPSASCWTCWPPCPPRPGCWSRCARLSTSTKSSPTFRSPGRASITARTARFCSPTARAGGSPAPARAVVVRGRQPAGWRPRTTTARAGAGLPQARDVGEQNRAVRAVIDARPGDRNVGEDLVEVLSRAHRDQQPGLGGHGGQQVQQLVDGDRSTVVPVVGTGRLGGISHHTGTNSPHRLAGNGP